MTKITKAKLELAEKKLELQERRALLKESKEKLSFEKTCIDLQKISVLNDALSTIFIKNDGENNKTEEYGFSHEEFIFLIKKYYKLLKEI